eukprot:m51a1_g3508 hypothetical protein (775) ;mRNA; r:866061-869024
MWRLLRRAALFLLLLGAHLCCGSAGHWLLGYYKGWEKKLLEPGDFDMRPLTHVAVCCATVRANGTLDMDFAQPSRYFGVQMASAVCARARSSGRVALLGIAGEAQSSSPAIPPLLRDNATLEALADAVLAGASEVGADGVDFALGEASAADSELWAALFRAVRKRAPHGVITANGPPLNSNMEPPSGLVDVVDAVDKYVMNTYYPMSAGAWSGWASSHVSLLTGGNDATPISIEGSLKIASDTKFYGRPIDKMKLGAGVDLVAICYSAGVTGPRQALPSGTVIRGGSNDEDTWSRLNAFVASLNVSNVKWDSVASNPYLSLPAPDSRGCQYYSFEDERSLYAKGRWISDNGYGGALVWGLANGYVVGAGSGSEGTTNEPYVTALASGLGILGSSPDTSSSQGKKPYVAIAVAVSVAAVASCAAVAGVVCAVLYVRRRKRQSLEKNKTSQQAPVKAPPPLPPRKAKTVDKAPPPLPAKKPPVFAVPGGPSPHYGYGGRDPSPGDRGSPEGERDIEDLAPYPAEEALMKHTSLVRELRAGIPRARLAKLEDSELEDFQQSFRQHYQMHHEDYNEKRIRRGLKPLIFVVTSCWKVHNPTLEQWFEGRMKFMRETLKRDPGEMRVRVAFHGTMRRNIDAICQNGLLRVGHPLNPSTSTDPGYFGDPHHGVYGSRFVEYTLQYANMRMGKKGYSIPCPLSEGETVKIIMLKSLPGKSRHMLHMQPGILPTPGYDSHSSPEWSEWFFFDETQTCPTYVVEIRAIVNNRTGANDGLNTVSS